MMKLHLLPLPALAIAAVIAAPAQAQEGTSQEVIVVSAQRANQTEVIAGGTLGVLGAKDALDVPFVVRTFDESLILNQIEYGTGIY